MKTRKAFVEDADLITQTIAMAEGELIPFFTGTRDETKITAALREFILSEKSNRYSLDNCLVAEADGKAVGAVFAFPADSQPELDKLLLAALKARGVELEELFFEGIPGSYYLSSMAVDPSCRGMGIGSALMEAAEQKGRDQGFKTASLLVATDKEKARALYERRGYTVVENAAIAQFTYYRMGKQLG